MPIHSYRRRSSHPYHNYHHRRRFSRKQRRIWPWFLLVLPLVLIAVGGVLYIRPLPLIAPQTQALALAASGQPHISWPAKSQAAFGTLKQGILSAQPNQKVKATASTIKLLTVLTVLDKKPLKIGEPGPMIPITQADADIYSKYVQENGSVALVTPGEKISQYQMIEGILIPSANNYADSLAIWAFGSLSNFQKAAQAKANSLGMAHTTAGQDASGFLPSSTSTAEDLTRLGIAAIKTPVIAEIVAKKTIQLPVAGIKFNTNSALSKDGIIGIKTGNTDQAGGVFIFAAKSKVADSSKQVTVVGAVQGEDTVQEAIGRARALIKQIQPQFQLLRPVRKGQKVVSYTSPWGSKSSATASKDIDVVYWPGQPLKPVIKLESIQPVAQSGSAVGSVSIGNQASPVILDKNLSPPSAKWRLLGIN